MKYTVSTKKVLSDIRKIDWPTRIEILTLKNQGWKDVDIARKLNMHRRLVGQHRRLMGEITVGEAEKLAQL